MEEPLIRRANRLSVCHTQEVSALAPAHSFCQHGIAEGITVEGVSPMRDQAEEVVRLVEQEAAFQERMRVEASKMATALIQLSRAGPQEFSTCRRFTRRCRRRYGRHESRVSRATCLVSEYGGRRLWSAPLLLFQAGPCGLRGRAQCGLRRALRFHFSPAVRSARETPRHGHRGGSSRARCLRPGASSSSPDNVNGTLPCR